LRKFGDLNFKNNKDGYAISIVIALLVGSVLLGYYYANSQPKQEGYLTIYLLNSQKNASDYPEFLVSKVNSTFSVYVVVENHEGESVNAQVQVKVVKDTNPSFPVMDVDPDPVFNGTIPNEKTWENAVTIPLNDPGNYLVVFELWTSTGNSGALEFSNDFCVLNVQVI
jgi:uncharacterized membrane protein